MGLRDAGPFIFFVEILFLAHTQTLGTLLKRGSQADARGTTHLVHRCGQAVPRGSCLSQVLDRWAQAAAHRCPRLRSLCVAGT
jgi:hypothetical protein